MDNITAEANRFFTDPNLGLSDLIRIINNFNEEEGASELRRKFVSLFNRVIGNSRDSVICVGFMRGYFLETFDSVDFREIYRVNYNKYKRVAA